MQIRFIRTKPGAIPLQTSTWLLRTSPQVIMQLHRHLHTRTTFYGYQVNWFHNAIMLTSVETGEKQFQSRVKRTLKKLCELAGIQQSLITFEVV